MEKIRLSNVIAPSFYQPHRNVKGNKYVHMWHKGGRGSCKSSFVSIEVLLTIKQNPMVNAVILRRVANTLRGSVFKQMQWAIDKLGLYNEFKCTVSPLEITYIPTGQKIIFLGADDMGKIKGTKFAQGYCGVVWFEELDQFAGMESIRSINQSLMRGGDKYWGFYSYNPPKSIQSWVNAESLVQRDDRFVHSSDYSTVPEEWLGSQFFSEAHHLAEHNERAYRHEYLGEPVGTGGNVFDNVTIRTIDDEEMGELRSGYILRGLDYGLMLWPI